MEPSQRIDSWNQHTDAYKFFDAVNFVDSIEDGSVYGSPIQKYIMDKAYRRIYSYILENKKFLNQNDADRVQLLADKVSFWGLSVGHRNSNLVKKIYSLASQLRIQEPLYFGYEFENLPFPSELVNLVSTYLPIEDIIEALAHGHFVAPHLIRQAFSNPRHEILQSFMNKIYKLRKMRLGDPAAECIKNLDAAVAYIRAFCKEARHSLHAEKWLTLSIQCLHFCKYDNENIHDMECEGYHPEDSGDLLCTQIANWIVECAPPFANEKLYLKTLKEFIEEYTKFPCGCRADDLQPLQKYVNNSGFI